MAFKLVGDQVEGIRKGQRKRVRSLLLDGIPSEEVFTMRNGRFACLVCEHRPVFDTTESLSVHRNGKKHLQSATRKVRSRETSTIKAVMDQSEGTPPMLVKTNQVKQDCLRRSTSVSSDTTSSNDDGCGGPMKLKCLEQTLAEEKGESTASHQGQPHQLDRSNFVFPQKHRSLKVKCKVAKTQLLDKPNNTKVSLRSSGWIPNGDGTWRQDSDVEFDSDEEAPSGAV